MEKRKTMGVVVLGVGLALVWGRAAMADDLNPPPYRGAPTSVFVHWNLDQSGAAPIDWGFGPDPDGNGPITESPVDPRLDIFTPDPDHPFTTYCFTVPNWIDELPLKLIRIQITTTDFTGTGATGVVGSIESEDGTAGPGAGVPVGSSPVMPVPGTTPDRLYHYEDWEIRPNPDFERVYVDVPNGVELNQVVIDSVSIPEPASLGLLGAGLVVVAARRRR